jgi:CelD/BcsL family acetyltransferase involved in cellulose biosynthesis
VKIVAIGDRGELEAHLAAWSELADEAGELFETPQWLLSWLEAYWPGRPWRFLLLYQDERLEGLLPLVDDARGELCCNGCLTLPINDHVERCGFLHRSAPGPLIEAAVRHLRQGQRRLRLRFHRSEAGPALEAHRVAARGQGLHFATRPASESPEVRLEGGYAEYLAGRSKNYRKLLRRKQRLLREAGSARWVVVAAAEDLSAHWPALLAVEARSWKAAQQTSIDTEPAAEAFYSALARRCAERGWLRSYLLYLEDQPVAHLLGVVHRQRYYALKSSYDGRHEVLSPGVLLFAQALEDCFAAGLERFEILGDAEQWKRQLATHWRRSLEICLFDSVLSRCGWVHGKHLVRPLLERHAPALLALGRRFGNGEDPDR